MTAKKKVVEAKPTPNTTAKATSKVAPKVAVVEKARAKAIAKAPPKARRKRRNNLNSSQVKTLLNLALSKDDLQNHQILDLFYEQTGIDVCEPSLYYHLKKNGIQRVFRQVDGDILENLTKTKSSPLYDLFSPLTDTVIEEKWKVIFVSPTRVTIYSNLLELSINIYKYSQYYTVKIECVHPEFFSDVSRMVKEFRLYTLKKGVSDLMLTVNKHIDAWKKVMLSVIDGKVKLYKNKMRDALHV